ncbi:uncharacterized protein GGS22DRAFT_151465 [Annulohypoxylon maeteangense]|uniref:uncharacterized protein n=1 Tax=Annulohypoxylon maeteangense TaxID=1927788 RepID=UPI002007C9A2|nr:uncharacterized protein GGS22DRAFT_151465 [Annulohypoxylon maeteangense]KAI0890638.1 hypothetical protein GGS22DRAFT_151465 [Annulohypoxylon maeteangense]
MVTIRSLVKEVKLMNCYVYAQWFILSGLVSDFILTVIALPIVATQSSSFSQLGDNKWIAWAYELGINIPTMFAIFWFYFLEEETTSRVRHEDLMFLCLWLLVATTKWIGYSIGLLYLSSAILFTAATICYGTAYLLCQSPRRTRLIGGSGVEYMMLEVPNKGGRNGCNWTGILCIIGIFIAFGCIGVGAGYGFYYALYVK